ncbi:LytR/AlgR family response regulator transcription factor [Chitinophaga nivalis]|uniref:LytTR family DNA-binding domain-containing protein n=1 Tax=Chitinophaga nivalis TaxID=2991709 RepID=A0ABT3IK22_9BACT|nr:LytTR family DNA-binding domain-containing protein [Chitinophaga nivalis]MCW3466015.1 LytTR family DNA-binding domain-containing protein [Chitinophaga nivalis]MCW3484294.1 LytTR family DNA-binding domain-containing protein [Chitinophaga nivalis]
MKCMVVDDEPFALALTKQYIAQTPSLQLCGDFTNPYKALAHLQATPVDLLLLDINMPGLSGLQLLASLPVAPMVIFTTAYAEFGAESYEYNAIDYLLKPINYPRFLRAVNKAIAAATPRLQTAPPAPEIIVKSGSRIHKIPTDTIYYIEAAGNYMRFHTASAKILSLLNMQELLTLLPAQDFIRIHKSYVVALKHISVFEKNQVEVNGTELPVGLTFRQQFRERMCQK